MLSYEQWPWKNLPLYVGSCYLFARAAVHPLLAAAQVSPFYPGLYEDMYMTGILTDLANVTIRTNFNR